MSKEAQEKLEKDLAFMNHPEGVDKNLLTPLRVILPNEDLPLFRPVFNEQEKIYFFDFETTTQEPAEVYSWGLYAGHNGDYFEGKNIYTFILELYNLTLKLSGKGNNSIKLGGFNNGKFDNFFMLRAIRDINNLKFKNEVELTDFEKQLILIPRIRLENELVLGDGKILSMDMVIGKKRIKIQDFRAKYGAESGLKGIVAGFCPELKDVQKGDWDYNLCPNMEAAEKVWANPELSAKLREYQRRDCEGLAEAYKVRAKFGCGKMTASGEAYAIFRADKIMELGFEAIGDSLEKARKTIGKTNLIYIADALDNEKSAVEAYYNLAFHVGTKEYERLFPHLSLELKEWLKPFYQGGYTNINYNNTHEFKAGKLEMIESGEIDSYDIASNYPSAMVRYAIPYGRPILKDLDCALTLDEVRKIKNDDNVVFVKVYLTQLKMKPNKPPLIQIYDADRRFWNTGYYYQSEELITYLEMRELENLLANATYATAIITQYCAFAAKKGIFDRYINTFYKLKATSKEEGKTALNKTTKLFLNGLYGKFGSKDFGKMKVLGLKGEKPVIQNIYVNSQDYTKQVLKEKRELLLKWNSGYKAVKETFTKGSDAYVAAMAELGEKPKMKPRHEELFTKQPNLGGYEIWTDEQIRDNGLADVNPVETSIDNNYYLPAAICITEGGRLNLFEGILSVGWENIFHCDTDSMKVKAGTKLKGLTIGESIGNWAQEDSYLNAKFAAPKRNMRLKVDGKFALTMNGFNTEQALAQLENLEAFNYGIVLTSKQRETVAGGYIITDKEKVVERPNIMEIE